MTKYFLILLTILLSFQANAGQEFEACKAKATDDTQIGLCMKAETTRLLKETQEIYLNMSKNELGAKWNKGNGLVKGNLKDMYDSWLAYRNRFCSLFEAVSVENVGSRTYNHERCLLNLTNDHYELMKSAMISAVSGGEESAID